LDDWGQRSYSSEKGVRPPMRKLRRRKIGEILVSEGLLTMEALQDSEIRQRKTGESLIEVLLAEGILSETDIVRCICSHYQLPYIQPSRYKFDPQLLELFEVEFLYGNRILPLGRIGDCAMVTLAEIPPQDVEQKIQESLDAEVFFFLSTITEIESALRQHFQLGQDDTLAIENARRSLSRVSRPASGGSASDSETLLQSLDDSWENIFEQAERNVRDGHH